jgi:hypothetical protein
MIFDNVKVGDKFVSKTGTPPGWIKVTELTDNGFKYECEPYNVYPLRYGPSLATSGEFILNAVPEKLWDCWYRKEFYNEQWDWVEQAWKRPS